MSKPSPVLFLMLVTGSLGAASFSRDPLGPEWVTAAATDRAGNLWVTSEGEGVWRLPPAGFGWKIFGESAGLGDTVNHGVACDRLGRIWVGTIRHGVSVHIEGKGWKNYPPQAGPLGERTFAIAAAPDSGDVWIATSRGLTRYRESDGSWRTFTRADGLPADQIHALAFTAQGRLVAGTACDGIAILATTPDVVVLRQIPGPNRKVYAPEGKGLPSGLINALHVTKTGRILAGTSGGLAWSDDNGAGWQYVRGANVTQKAALAWPPAKPDKPAATTLARLLPEDHVTGFSESPDGAVTVFFRQKPPAFWSPGRPPAPRQDLPGIKRTGAWFLAEPKRGVFVGYGAGVVRNPEATPSPATPPPPAAASPDFPPERPRPTRDDLLAMADLLRRKKSEGAPQAAWFLGQDWMTRGDAIGRYGRDKGVLCAMVSPGNHRTGRRNDITFQGDVGPNIKGDESLRAWVHSLETDHPDSLYTQVCGHRREAENDDHGEAYPQDWDGPDVWYAVKVPPGPQRLSLYFYSPNGHLDSERMRDFVVNVRKAADARRPLPKIVRDARPDLPEKTVRFSPAESLKNPVLARARTGSIAGGGVYLQFVVQGPGYYAVQIEKNHSLNTILNGVFVDHLTPGFTPDDLEHERGKILFGDFIAYPDKGMLATLNPWRNRAQAKAGCDTYVANLKAPPKDEAEALWRECQNPRTLDGRQASYLVPAARMLALAATEDPGDASLRRWEIPLWTEEDRREFLPTLREGLKWVMAANEGADPETAAMRDTIRDAMLANAPEAPLLKNTPDNSTHSAQP